MGVRVQEKNMKILFASFLILFSSAGEASPHKIMIFGGEGHKVYLGCLNCSEYASDSVFNEISDYGSEFSSESILNSFSDYGSEFSDYSACNDYASDPPVIVDESGNFYGRLTINDFNPEQSKDEQLIDWLKNKVCDPDK